MSVEFDADVREQYGAPREPIGQARKGSKLASMLISSGLAKDERSATTIALITAAVCFVAAIAVYLNMSSGPKPVVRNGGRTPIPPGVQPLGTPNQ